MEQISPQPQQVNSVIPSKSSSKLFPFIIGLILIFIVGVGSYVLGTSKNKVLRSPSAQVLRCEKDFDCVDDNVCTDDICTKGVCSNPNSIDGKSCGANLPGEEQIQFCDGAGQCVYRGPIQPGPLEDPETANPDSIGANWKTKSTDFLSFKYPSDWQEQSNEDKATGGYFSFRPIYSDNKIGLIVNEYTHINPSETPSQLAEQALGKNEIPLNRKEIMVDRHKSVYQERQEIDGMGKSVRRIEIYIGGVKEKTNFLPEDGGPRLTSGTLSITMTIYDGSMLETGRETLNQILSTFKFTTNNNSTGSNVQDESLDGFVLLSPNGKELMKMGSTQEIKWSDNKGFAEKTSIYLEDTQSIPWKIVPIANNLLPSTYSYLWTVSSDNTITPGKKYKILLTASIKDVTKMGLTDETDGFFEISK